MTMNLRSVPALVLMSFFLTTAVHSSKEEVRQSPLSAEFVEGQTATLNCTFDRPGAKSYKWWKDDLKIHQAIAKYHERVNENSQQSNNELFTSVRISNLSVCDSGTYYCIIEQLGRQFKGAGASLIVRRASQEKQCPPNIIHIGTAAAVLSVLCIALIAVSVKFRQRSKACIALQRQFVAYITETSTESAPSNKKGKHAHREGKTSSSCQEEKRKKKRKPKEHHRMENADYVHVGPSHGRQT
ncbi:uncharacterized protein [Chiloscyllium punctatum]|uniref:uncharacterized protein n=1 Tax=Chiloscyllium punctatum TaxID=137246 RepID=UPI003B63BFAA